jgi:hypothetical protein
MNARGRGRKGKGQAGCTRQTLPALALNFIEDWSTARGDGLLDRAVAPQDVFHPVF